MMKQMFKDIQPEYDREMNILKVLQYNGESFEYEFNDHTEVRDVQVPTTGQSIVNEAVVD